MLCAPLGCILSAKRKSRYRVMQKTPGLLVALNQLRLQMGAFVPHAGYDVRGYQSLKVFCTPYATLCVCKACNDPHPPEMTFSVENIPPRCAAFPGGRWHPSSSHQRHTPVCCSPLPHHHPLIKQPKPPPSSASVRVPTGGKLYALVPPPCFLWSSWRSACQRVSVLKHKERVYFPVRLSKRCSAACGAGCTRRRQHSSTATLRSTPRSLRLHTLR